MHVLLATRGSPHPVMLRSIYKLILVGSRTLVLFATRGSLHPVILRNIYELTLVRSHMNVRIVADDLHKFLI